MSDTEYYRRFLNDRDADANAVQVSALSASTIIRDIFHRASSQSLGTGWYEDERFSFEIGIDSNEAFLGWGYCHRTETFVNNQAAQIIVGSPILNVLGTTIINDVGVAIRLNANGFFDDVSGYGFILKATGAWSLRKFSHTFLDDNTSGTILDSGTGLSFAQGTKVLIEAIGTNIRAYVNKILISSVIDSSITSGRPGLVSFSTGSGKVSEFIGSTITAIVSDLSEIFYYRRSIHDNAVLDASVVQITESAAFGTGNNEDYYRNSLNDANAIVGAVRLRIYKNDVSILETTVDLDDVSYIASGIFGIATVEANGSNRIDDNYKGGDSVTNTFTDSFTGANADTLGASWNEDYQDSIDACFHIVSNGFRALSGGDLGFLFAVASPTVATAIVNQHSELEYRSGTGIPLLSLRGNGIEASSWLGYVAAIPNSAIEDFIIYWLQVSPSAVNFLSLTSISGISLSAGDRVKFEAINI